MDVQWAMGGQWTFTGIGIGKYVHFPHFLISSPQTNLIYFYYSYTEVTPSSFNSLNHFQKIY
jgi:hypothetical protein